MKKCWPCYVLKELFGMIAVVVFLVAAFAAVVFGLYGLLWALVEHPYVMATVLILWIGYCLKRPSEPQE